MSEPTDKMIDYAQGICEELEIEEPDLTSFQATQLFLKKYVPIYRKVKYQTKLHDSRDVQGYMEYMNYEPTQEFLDFMVNDDLYGRAGVYAFWYHNKLLYVGKSTNLGDRLYSSFREKFAKPELITKIGVYVTDTVSDAHIIEPLIIVRNKPLLNVDCQSYDDTTLEIANEPTLEDFKKVEVLKNGEKKNDK